MRILRAGVAALLAGAALTAVPHAAFAASGDDQQFSATVFRATHNSYSGNISGSRGSIGAQLDAGVRFVEFDVWSGSHAGVGDYQIGHGSVGDQVDHTGGNPAGNGLRDWLATVNSWSAAHPSAAPITVMLDLKDDLTSRTSYADGNFAALNQEITDAFGARLQKSGALGTIGSLRGRVLVLLSGNATARTGYKLDNGTTPAIAINASGQVVEVHDSGSGVLWYWTGQYGSDGRVTWLRHGKYDSGVTPAVAINNDGTVVEVHKSQSNDGLWSHVGHLDASGEITWSASAKYDSGATPTIAFTDLGGTAVREIHKSQSSSQNWDWQGVAGSTAITWGAHATTSDARFPTTSAGANGRTVAVSTGPLSVTTGQAAAERVRYPQVAFDEYQDGDSAELKNGSVFWAATASDKSFIVAGRQAGVSVRGWDFDSASLATSPLANYPATNSPYADWYTSMVTAAGAVA